MPDCAARNASAAQSFRFPHRQPVAGSAEVRPERWSGVKGSLAGAPRHRLYPLTRGQQAASAGLHKPVIYYPLSMLMLAGIMTCSSSARHRTRRLEQLLGDSSQIGVSLSYRVQPNPGGTQAPDRRGLPCRRLLLPDPRRQPAVGHHLQDVPSNQPS
jgi:hypothetical protein